MLMLASLRSLRCRYPMPMPETFDVKSLKPALLPKLCHRLEKNSKHCFPVFWKLLGARSSCHVQARVKNLLCAEPSNPSTSAR